MKTKCITDLQLQLNLPYLDLQYPFTSLLLHGNLFERLHRVFGSKLFSGNAETKLQLVNKITRVFQPNESC